MRRVRWITFIGAVTLVLVVSGGAIVAQGGLGDIFKSEPNDSDIVAVVGGVAVTMRPFRTNAETERLRNPALSENEALKQAILPVLEQFAAYAEARRRGLEVPKEEARRFADMQRALCEGPDGEDCRQFIASTGMSMDEYWASAVAGYQQGLSIANLMRALVKERNLYDAADEKRLAYWSNYLHTLLGETVIEWKDSRLESLYHAVVNQP